MMNESEAAKLQVSSEFKPDKLGLWQHPAEKDGWMLAHNMLRDEVDAFIEAVESVSNKFPNATPTWAIEYIQQVWHYHEDTVHAHHSNEDNIMNPFMKTRVKLPEKLEDDHVVVVERINDVSEAVKNLKEGESLDNLLSLVRSYKDTLLPHLREEEEVALPLLRFFFTPKEVQKVVLKILDETRNHKSEGGSFVNSMGEDYFRSTFMKQEGIPFFVWHLKFKHDFNFFLKNVHSYREAMKKGVPLEVKKKATMLC